MQKDFPKNEYSSSNLNERIDYIKQNFGTIESLNNDISNIDFEQLKGSIENFIGFTQVPTGVVGPLKVSGNYSDGEYLIPVATTEGALVASYHRGAKAANLSGGIQSFCIEEQVRRSPLFKFKSIVDALDFKKWLKENAPVFQQICVEKSNYAQLTNFSFQLEGNHLIVHFNFYTGDAAGQNMVTFCTDAITEYILKNSPISIQKFYIESNASGDKKANLQSLNQTRGKRVSAECVIKSEVIESVLKSSAKNMASYWQSSTLAVIQSGSIGAQGHFANGLAALFLATGQDIACVAEAHVGITRMEIVNEQDLYISVTLGNLIVGTVGGGTKFDTQKDCLKLMNCYGIGNANKFAELCAALVLCGEASIAAAIAEGHFTSAHKNLGR